MHFPLFMEFMSLIIYIAFSSVFVVDVYISTNHESPSVGQHYEISCDAQGVQHNSGINITYTWIKNNETIPTKLNTLYFSHIKMSDAGHYICITSLWLNNQSQEINATHDLYLQGKCQLANSLDQNKISYMSCFPKHDSSSHFLHKIFGRG